MSPFQRQLIMSAMVSLIMAPIMLFTKSIIRFMVTKVMLPYTFQHQFIIQLLSTILPLSIILLLSIILFLCIILLPFTNWFLTMHQFIMNLLLLPKL